VLENVAGTGTGEREMQTQFRKAATPGETRSLVTFDHKVFRRADWFDREDWQTYEPWWMIIDSKKVGCCAFERHVDFQEDIREDGVNPRLRGSLYIVSTGILPRFRNQGFGTLLKSWQISYAWRHNFTRIVTNTRKSNKAMIGLNEKFGFHALRTTRNYYEDPLEPTVVMELKLKEASRL
jgi:RimJ/RimL family protein N-acetyltransferase